MPMIRKKRFLPDWKVTYITSEDFTNRFVQAMRLDKLGAFRKQFRECDVLLVDDLHFLATKKATQEEFLHTFDVLLADGRQLVLTCDCHPRLADDFSPELVDRLLGGAVWPLTPPDATKTGVKEPSMGPPSDNGGYGQTSAGVMGCMGGPSMGPPSDNGGYAGTALYIDPPYFTLQWVRRPITAVMREQA